MRRAVFACVGVEVRAWWVAAVLVTSWFDPGCCRDVHTIEDNAASLCPA
jgi:hypothetical protein